MKRAAWFALVALVLFALLIYIATIYTRNPSRTPQEARERIRAGKYDVVIDVRTPDEWAQGHHSNAISIPIGEFVTKLPETVPNKDARILIVCRKGIRSKAAALMAKDLGYTHVEWVAGLHNGLREST
jgi:rhodanese-related sulfurtransferase